MISLVFSSFARRNLPAEERGHWDDVAAKDKQRYMVEKASYTGPWQVPWKRARKDPCAPKRPMSAFLYFSQGRRTKLKTENPNMKNTEVSRLLGEMWRNAADEERNPYIEKEKEEREKYKVAVAEWRKEYEEKMEEKRKQQAEQQNWVPPYMGEPIDVPAPLPYADPNMHYSQPPPYMPPAGYGYPGNPYPYRKFDCAKCKKAPLRMLSFNNLLILFRSSGLSSTPWPLPLPCGA